MRGDETAREAAIVVLRKLTDAGYVAHFAGGCVRDRVMGIEPKDHDIATNARPEQALELFPHAQAVGAAFGVILVSRRGHTMEIATFRADGVYSDGRHPDAVTFGDAEHDAARRDFTINGLFENPLTGEIIDYVGGRADIASGVIRAIGDATERLHEDQLRMLRAIRFAARFQFSIDPDTAGAIQRHAHTLRGVSRERIGQEVRWMMVDANRATAAVKMQRLGVDEAVLNELSHDAELPRLAGLPAAVPYATALAAWRLDRAATHLPGGASDRGERWPRALMLSGAERVQFAQCLAVHAALLGDSRGSGGAGVGVGCAWGELGVAGQKRLAASPGFEQGMLVLQVTDQDRFSAVSDRVRELERTGLAPAPLITGDDLIADGMTPGRVFKPLLDTVYDAQLEGAVTTREEAMDLARAHVSGKRG